MTEQPQPRPAPAGNDNHPEAGFPETLGSDLTVSDIDLDVETFIVGGQRLTEERAAELAEQAERRGRP